MISQGVKEADVEALSKSVDLATFPVNEKGEEGAEDSGAGFVMVFIIAFLIYMTILLYGQVVLGAIIEEKETRISEILFSSVRPIHIMFGKLIGVSLMAVTQLGIWAAGICSYWSYLRCPPWRREGSPGLIFPNYRRFSQFTSSFFSCSGISFIRRSTC